MEPYRGVKEPYVLLILMLPGEQMQIFKLWMPKERLYVFKRCRTIDLDIKPTTFAERFPVVVRELWRLKVCSAR